MSTTLELPKNPTVVVKVGTSSIADATGRLASERIRRLCRQLAGIRTRGAHVVLVSSGAVAAGLPGLGYTARPSDIGELQAIASVGQIELMDAYAEALGPLGLRPGQVLLTRHVFHNRNQYLHARVTLQRLLNMDVLPIVNENDTVADDELRFGENDRLSALVAHVIAADLLVILTDQPGVLSADPRFSADATLIEEVHALDVELEQTVDSGAGPLGSGGMASKLAAARMASWSGVTTLIADASDMGLFDGIFVGSVDGTVVRPHDRRLSSRKLWIAFGVAASGSLIVDGGAAYALTGEGGSLLPVGVVEVGGRFRSGDAVEVLDTSGGLIAKGLARLDSAEITAHLGQRDAPIAIHRDDLVVLRDA